MKSRCRRHEGPERCRVHGLASGHVYPDAPAPGPVEDPIRQSIEDYRRAERRIGLRLPRLAPAVDRSRSDPGGAACAGGA